MDQAKLIYEAPKDLIKEGTQVRPARGVAGTWQLTSLPCGSL